MKHGKLWVNLSIIGIFTVALLGFILRCKILFDIRFIDYNRLLDAHEHFAFAGWVTLALIYLMVLEILPQELNKRPLYQWVLGGIVLTAWGMLCTYPFGQLITISDFFSTAFIIITYVFGVVFIRDIIKSKASQPVKLLAISSVLSLMLSSVAIFTLAYLFSINSLNAILYRDALFTYLHLQYNGFFALAVFALLFHKMDSKMSYQARRNVRRLSIFLSCSILPSLFISFLWQDPVVIIRIIAIIGSIFLLLSFIWLIVTGLSMIEEVMEITPVMRVLGIMALSAFMLKELLQSFTIFPAIGDMVFGNRPIIIGYLHLVFLGFVTPFILIYYTHLKVFSLKSKFTFTAFIFFIVGIVLNEIMLMTQGMGEMIIKSTYLFPWLLWGISIVLFIGATLITIARFSTNSKAKS